MNCVRGLGLLSAAAAGVVCSVSASAGLVHQYTFNGGDASDSVGGAHGVLADGATVSGGQVHMAGGASGFGGEHVSLPGSSIGINGFSSVTIETWYTVTNPLQWARVFDFGETTGTGQGTDYIFQTHQSDDNGRIFAAISNTDPGNVGETRAHGSTSALGAGTFHTAVVFDGVAGSLSFYLNGTLMETNSTSVVLADLSNDNAFLGRALYNGDATFEGSIDEFRIYDNALTGSEVADSFAAGPVPVPEPGSMALLGLGGLFAMSRRRRS